MRPPRSHFKIPFPAVALVLMAAMVVVAGVVLWPVSASDSREPGPTVLAAMPSSPTQKWRVTAADVLDEHAETASLLLRAEGSGVLIVEAIPALPETDSTLAAIDDHTGEVLWTRRGAERWAGCGISGDETLVCVRNARDGATTRTRVDFFNLADGVEQHVQTASGMGWPQIAVVGDMVVVETDGTDIDALLAGRESTGGIIARMFMVGDSVDGPGDQGQVTAFTSAGQVAWSAQPPVNQTYLGAVSGSGLVATKTLRGTGVSLYRAIAGELVYQSPAPGRIRYALYDSGFAVSESDPAIVRFFDENGHETGRLDGWKLAIGEGYGSEDSLVDSERIPVVADDDRRVGVVAADAAAVSHTWEARQDPHAQGVRRLDDRVWAIASDDVDVTGKYSQTWRFVDTDSGAELSRITTGFGQWILGYDGTRVLLGGDPSQQQKPNVPRLTAVDVRTGAETWQIQPADPTARWVQFGDGVYLVEAVDHQPGWIARYR